MKLTLLLRGILAFSGLSLVCQGQTVYTILDGITDGSGQTGFGTGPDITPVGFTGIDDTFSGNMTIAFDVDVASAQATLGGTGAVNFTFFNGSTRILAVGNAWFSPNWGFWKAIGDPNTEYDLLDVGTNPVEVGDGVNASDSASFIVSLNYVAGGDDSGVIQFADGSASAAIPAGDYSFDSLMAGGYGPINTFTNGTLTVTAVPEPAMMASLLGAFGLLALGLRRRR